jgi:GT2 family glycosyltransferase
VVDQAIAPSLDLSVILASHNEGEWLRRTVDAFLDVLPARSEIVVVDDRSTDGSAEFLRGGYCGVKFVTPRVRRGAAGARNAGARLAVGKYLVFSDAHIALDPGWFEPLRDALDQPNVGAAAPAISSIENRELKGFGHTWRTAMLDWDWLPRGSDEPHPVPFVPAGFVALQRETFERSGGFDSGLLIWGSVGDELSLRLWLLGQECLVVPKVEVAHLFRKQMPYSLDWAPVLHNMMRLAVLHFSPRRVVRIFSELAPRSAFDAAFSQLTAGNAWRMRERYRGLQARDDDWFFKRFGITVLDD